MPASSSVSNTSYAKYKLLAFLLLIVGLAALWYLYRESLSLDALARRESQLRQFQAEHPRLIFGLAFIVYVVVTGFSIPVATALTLTYAWLFGFWPALVLVSFGSTSGGAMAFLLSRYLLGDAVRARYGERLRAISTAIERDGAFYLLSLRLIPYIPFFLVNVLMGLTPIRLRTFWWASQLGMLPATSIYTYAGSTVPTLTQFAEQGIRGILTWQLALALMLLGLFPLVVKRVLRKRHLRLESESSRK